MQALSGFFHLWIIGLTLVGYRAEAGHGAKVIKSAFSVPKKRLWSMVAA